MTKNIMVKAFVSIPIFQICSAFQKSLLPLRRSFIPTKAGNAHNLFRRGNNGANNIKMFATQALHEQNYESRDMSLLEDWAYRNQIVVSPSITISSTRREQRPTTPEEGEDRPHQDATATSTTINYDYGIQTTKFSNASEVVLSVPRNIVWDSEALRHEWLDVVTEPLTFIERSGFHESATSFLLMVKLLQEYSLGSASRWHEWIETLPKTFDTGVCMNGFERSCLPPFAYAIANFETQQLETFREAFHTVTKTSSLFENVDLGIFNDELTLWAFNVVTTRSWRYQEDDNENDTGTARPILVPFGDMFNHHEPPNVVVRDKNNTGENDAIEFLLAHDVDAHQSLCLSYGLTTNPHRFLAIFGFVDETMPSLFSQVLFENPSPQMIELGCNDRSRMVYWPADGGISTTVWDCVLHVLLDQVPAEQERFFNAHKNGDMPTKQEFHQKYALEESLTLRNHVVGTIKELQELLDKIDGLNDEEKKAHRRIDMIRQHNQFLHRTFSLVLQRIESRAQAEVVKRRGMNK